MSSFIQIHLLLASLLLRLIDSSWLRAFFHELFMVPCVYYGIWTSWDIRGQEEKIVWNDAAEFRTIFFLSLLLSTKSCEAATTVSMFDVRWTKFIFIFGFSGNFLSFCYPLTCWCWRVQFYCIIKTMAQKLQNYKSFDRHECSSHSQFSTHIWTHIAAMWMDGWVCVCHQTFLWKEL